MQLSLDEFAGIEKTCCMMQMRRRADEAPADLPHIFGVRRKKNSNTSKPSFGETTLYIKTSLKSFKLIKKETSTFLSTEEKRKKHLL